MEIYGKFIGIHGNRKKMMAINLWHHKWGKKKGNWGGLTPQICWTWMGIELLELMDPNLWLLPWNLYEFMAP